MLPDEEREQTILYLWIAVIGAIPVVIGLWRGGVFGPEPTVGLTMALLALAGLLAMRRGRRGGRR